MTKRTNQSKLTIYRRHAGKCPLHGEKASRILDGCECPLWAHGKVRGKQTQVSLDTRELAAAIIRRDEMLAGKPDDDPTTPEGIQLIRKRGKEHKTIADAASEFLESKGSKGSNTVKAYTRAITHFSTWAAAKGLVYLRQIETSHLREYFRSFGPESNSGWNATTAQSYLTYLRTWFNYCCAPSRRWLEFSPAAERDLMQNDSTSAPKRTPFTPDQVTQILAAVERMPAGVRDKVRALVLLMLFTGMRISDATFFEREYVKDSNAADYYVIKTRSPITLPPTLQKPALDALAKLPKTNVYFFQEDSDDHAPARRALRRGKEFCKLMPGYEARLQVTTKLVKKLLALAGVKGSCHTFRDTFAINMLVGDGETGADIFTVSKMLGHSDVKITDEHYMKLVPGYRERMSQQTKVLSYRFPKAS